MAIDQSSERQLPLLKKKRLVRYVLSWESEDSSVTIYSREGVLAVSVGTTQPQVVLDLRRRKLHTFVYGVR